MINKRIKIMTVILMRHNFILIIPHFIIIKKKTAKVVTESVMR